MNKTTLISANENDAVLLQYIYEFLLDLGFRPKLKGFGYLKEAIYLYANASFVNSIFKEVYSIIAQKYIVTAARRP